ncbi:MAG: hypothetical protein EA394_04790 [Bacteroidia bacterium]|nr:MAG: hypothetical protein EA394_04790 [Bacteroidia bacterium]
MNRKILDWVKPLAFIIAGLLLVAGCSKDKEVLPDDDLHGKVFDADGNEYGTVIIGNQVWLTGNLKTTRYKNGNPIATGHSNEQWANLSTGAYAIYPHAAINGLSSEAEVLSNYGALYNWHAVKTGNLCPKGWRVPTDSDWSQLISFIDPDANSNYQWPESFIAGGKLKSTRTNPDAHPSWEYPNTDATDEFDFSAFPGGLRANDGETLFNGFGGYWWSATETSTISAFYRTMIWENGHVYRLGVCKNFGLSVRCVREK